MGTRTNADRSASEDHSGVMWKTLHHAVLSGVARSVAPAAVFLALLGAFAPSACAQEPEGPLSPIVPLRGALERITVHGASLEGNLEGDNPDRPVTVYLPPGYASSPGRRYPVLYMLHGFTDSDLNWMGWREHFVNVPAAMERALDAGTVQEMIIVMPNAYTAYAGSMYSSSVTTGDWETFVAEEVVAYVDANYRTIPERGSRGLAGHSMGGYGTMRIGMKRPDVFGSIYAMSACCMPASLDPEPERFEQLVAIRTMDEVDAASFGAKIAFASSAAWSPNPNAPPFYLDFPVADGAVQPDVVARQAANSIFAMIDQYVPELRALDAIALDCGEQDFLVDGTRELSRILDSYGIEHTAEIYDPGNHVSHVDGQVELRVLPFFSRQLRFP